jgi:hypothetical protein
MPKQIPALDLQPSFHLSISQSIVPVLVNRDYTPVLRAERPMGRSSSPGRVKNFQFYISSRPAVGDKDRDRDRDNFTFTIIIIIQGAES